MGGNALKITDTGGYREQPSRMGNVRSRRCLAWHGSVGYDRFIKGIAGEIGAETGQRTKGRIWAEKAIGHTGGGEGGENLRTTIMSSSRNQCKQYQN